MLGALEAADAAARLKQCTTACEDYAERVFAALIMPVVLTFVLTMGRTVSGGAPRRVSVYLKRHATAAAPRDYQQDGIRLILYATALGSILIVTYVAAD